MFKFNGQFKKGMSLDTLKQKLVYLGAGGRTEESRMQEDKLRTLKRALLYSYQAATAILPDEREFRCLINDNKLSTDYDNKIISIPYRDICLNKEKSHLTTTSGEEDIGLQCGDVFTWKETDSHWLVYLEYLEEDAYFRAQIRRCDVEAEVSGHHYWIYVRGPVETTIQWRSKHNISWNDMNYSLCAYITKNEETEDFFHRFKRIKIDGNWWEIKTVNPYFGDGIIEMYLGEWFNNEMAEKQIIPEEPEPDIDLDDMCVIGNFKVHPFDVVHYEVYNAPEGGLWTLSNKKACIIDSSSDSLSLEILTGKSGSFILQYEVDEEIYYQVEILIESL